MTLAQTRQRCQEAWAVLASGIDPMKYKQQPEAQVVTFEGVARQWWAHWSTGRSKRHADYVLRRLDADIFPEIWALLVGNMPTSAFPDAVKKIELRRALDIAKRALQTCGQISGMPWRTIWPRVIRSRGGSIPLLDNDGDSRVITATLEKSAASKPCCTV